MIGASGEYIHIMYNNICAITRFPSRLEDVGSLAAHSKSERFERMRSFNSGKGGDEAVVAMRSDSTTL